jgi:hypothetical protein
MEWWPTPLGYYAAAVWGIPDRWRLTQACTMLGLHRHAADILVERGVLARDEEGTISGRDIAAVLIRRWEDDEVQVNADVGPTGYRPHRVRTGLARR